MADGNQQRVTDVDRETAERMLYGHVPDDFPMSRPDRMRRDRVATALAAERARTIAAVTEPFSMIARDMPIDSPELRWVRDNLLTVLAEVRRKL
jgi:hypothetical protein